MPRRESNKKSPQSLVDHGLRCPHQQYNGVLPHLSLFINLEKTSTLCQALYSRLFSYGYLGQAFTKSIGSRRARRKAIENPQRLLSLLFQKTNGNVGLRIRQKPGICPICC